MSMFCAQHPVCGRHSRHSIPQASGTAHQQCEATPAALDCRTLGRGGLAARTDAFWQCGASQQGTQTAGEGRPVGSYRHGCVRQGETWGTFWCTDGQATARSIGSRNLRSARDSLAAWRCTAPLQLRGHHPGAMAHHLQYGQTTHQPTAADRQTGGRL